MDDKLADLSAAREKLEVAQILAIYEQLRTEVVNYFAHIATAEEIEVTAKWINRRHGKGERQ